MSEFDAAGAGALVAPGGPATSRKSRLYYLDNLRAAAVLAVLLLHTAICYMVAAPQWWYVVDPDQSLVFTVIVLVVDVPIMSTMFLVAGYFAMPSLRRRGLGGFVREKLTRLGAPWVFGALVLAPAVTYLSYVSRGIRVPYLQFWTNDFWGPMYQQAVYWFLGLLLLFFLLVALTARLRPGLVAPPLLRGGTPWRALLVVFLAGVAGVAAVSPWVGLDDWVPNARVLVLQPARVALYAAFFLLGIHAERHGWLSRDGWRPSVRFWIPTSVVTGSAYLAFRVVGYSTTVPARLVGGVLFVAFCIASVLAAVAGFARWVDRSTPVWRTLADNAFGIYYVHPVVLYPAAWLLVGLAVPGALKAIVVLVASLLISLAISAGILRRAPVLRRMF